LGGREGKPCGEQQCGQRETAAQVGREVFHKVGLDGRQSHQFGSEKG
jgi:hypothetical protein